MVRWGSAFERDGIRGRVTGRGYYLLLWMDVVAEVRSCGWIGFGVLGGLLRQPLIRSTTVLYLLVLRCESWDIHF